MLEASSLIRDRIAAVSAARWRAPDRDRLARRLLHWALTAARRAARRGNSLLLQRLDGLVTRLTRGLTAGEELMLRVWFERRAALSVRELLAWHEGLPALLPWPDSPEISLEAAVIFGRDWPERCVASRP